MKCPQCAALHRPMPFCPACGHQYPKRESVQHGARNAEGTGGHGGREPLRRQLWPQIAYHAVESCNGDMDRAQRKAQAIYHDITGEFCKARVETTGLGSPITRGEQQDSSTFIRWAHRRKSAQEAASAV